MHRSPAVLIAAVIAAVTMFASGTQAGFGIRLGFGGPLPAFTAHGNGGYEGERHYHRKRYIERRVKEKTHVAKRKNDDKVAKKSEPKVSKKVAKSETPAASADSPQAAAPDAENSSITTVSATAETSAPAPTTPVETVKNASPPAVAEETKPSPAKTASKLDCKKFFPSVGMTLTVPCE